MDGNVASAELRTDTAFGVPLDDGAGGPGARKVLPVPAADDTGAGAGVGPIGITTGISVV